MKNTFSETARGLVKNPIGVIGLFLVLVEAIAAIVIVNSSLINSLNLILVLFVTLFPILVLIMFYNLVTRHHEKLYSPSDFRDEKNFVETYNKLTQSNNYIQKDISVAKVNSQSNDGMSKDDIKLIKETLNSVMSMQKQMVAENKKTTAIKELEKVEKDINERLENYAEKKNGKYHIFVTNMKKCTHFIETLHRMGYNAEIYEYSFKNNSYNQYEEHEAIWLGREVPVNMIVEVIKLAKSMFPHLKYIEFNDDCSPKETDYEIYIGGATSTAKDSNLKQLKEGDFEKLYAIKDKDEMQKFVGKFSNN